MIWKYGTFITQIVESKQGAVIMCVDMNKGNRASTNREKQEREWK